MCASCAGAVLTSLNAGGHTSEAFSLLSGLDFARYRPRTYVVSHGDRLSAKKAVDFETVRSSDTSPHTVSIYDCLLLPGMTMGRILRGGHFYFSSYLLADIVQSHYHPTRTSCASAPSDDPIFLRMVACGVHLPRLPGADNIRDVICGCVATKRARYLYHAGLGNVPEQGELSSSGRPSIAVLIHNLQLMGLPSPRLIYVESFARVKRLSLSGKILHRLVDRYVTHYAL